MIEELDSTDSSPKRKGDEDMIRKILVLASALVIAQLMASAASAQSKKAGAAGDCDNVPVEVTAVTLTGQNAGFMKIGLQFAIHPPSCAKVAKVVAQIELLGDG